MSQPKLAIVTGASSGIGLELAKLAAEDGFDLIVAVDTPFVEAAPALKEFGVAVEDSGRVARLAVECVAA